MPETCGWCNSSDPMDRKVRFSPEIRCNNTSYHPPEAWAAKDPIQCSYGNCDQPAIWDRKDGWMVAPGSPPGPVCETHHCWERIA